MKRAGISLTLVVMLLLGAAAPVQAQAEETGLAAEAESFYRSVLAAKDRETLQTYLDCFSDQRRVELRAELPATLRQGLDTVLQQMKLPSITPVEENTQQKETGWQLDASTTWDLSLIHISYLARYYPLETAYGRYGGGVYFEQNWQPYRIYMTPLQERALQHAISSAAAEDVVPLQEILQTFARK